MRPEERADLLECLERGRKMFREAVAGVADADAERAPGPGQWSVLDCAEHVAVVEQFLYARLLEGRPDPAAAIPPGREALIRARAADRSRRVPAPEAAVPAGRYRTLQEALAAFEEARARTLAFVEACEEDLRGKVTTHPILKTATCLETLLMMAAHPERHAKQVAEIRAGGR
jgi:DinB superfamily